MADAFKLTGSYDVTPLTQPLSFAPSITAPIMEARTTQAKTVTDVLLDADAPVAVAFGDVQEAHVVILKAVGGPVVASLTSDAGAAQDVPFDTYMILMSEEKPITAITLTRSPNTETQVRIFLAQKA